MGAKDKLACPDGNEASKLFGLCLPAVNLSKYVINIVEIKAIRIFKFNFLFSIRYNNSEIINTIKNTINEFSNNPAKIKKLSRKEFLIRTTNSKMVLSKIKEITTKRAAIK